MNYHAWKGTIDTEMQKKSPGFDSASWSSASLRLHSVLKLYFKMTTSNIGNDGSECILDNPFSVKLRWGTHVQGY